jgi:hypothetical protein
LLTQATFSENAESIWTASVESGPKTAKQSVPDAYVKGERIHQFEPFLADVEAVDVENVV